jgi:hypothetical protein
MNCQINVYPTHTVVTTQGQVRMRTINVPPSWDTAVRPIC